MVCPGLHSLFFPTAMALHGLCGPTRTLTDHDGPPSGPIHSLWVSPDPLLPTSSDPMVSTASMDPD